MKKLGILSVLTSFVFMILCSCGVRESSFVSIENGRFSCKDYASHYIGVNLHSVDVPVNELDSLKGLGLTHVRLRLDEDMSLTHLDSMLVNAAECGMKAVICFKGGVEVWSADMMESVVTRMNSLTGMSYNEDTTIFAWQIESADRNLDILESTAALIKSFDQNHLLSVTCHADVENRDFEERLYSCPDVDYLGIQLWPYDWNWVNAASVKKDLQEAIKKTDDRIEEYTALAQKYGKPLVIDEFAFPRDDASCSKNASINARNDYFQHIFQSLIQSARVGGTFAGASYSEWGGLNEYSVYSSDGWTNLITLVSIQDLDKALLPQLTLDIIEQSNGIFEQSGLNTLDLTARYVKDLKAELEFIVETEFGDTVMTFGKKVKFLADKDFPISFDVDFRPGFYRVKINLLDKQEGRVELTDRIIGCMPEDIDSPKEKPADLDVFWEQTLSELAEVKPEYKLTLIKEQSNEVRRTYRVDMKSFGGESICGIYVEPVASGKYPAMIYYMGYDTQVWDIDPSANPEMSEFILCVRGQALNKKGDKAGWVSEGIGSKETYYYRGALADVVRAIDFVCSREKTDTSLVFAQGESQGGAFTLAAASLDDRLSAIAPSAPFMCDFSDFLILAPWPSDEMKQAAQEAGMTDEQLREMLNYFDMKNLGERITCPMIMGMGLQDNICPIHTNFAGYNVVSSEKSWICYPKATHNVWIQPHWKQAKEDFFRAQILRGGK